MAPEKQTPTCEVGVNPERSCQVKAHLNGLPKPTSGQGGKPQFCAIPAQVAP